MKKHFALIPAALISACFAAGCFSSGNAEIPSPETFETVRLADMPSATTTLRCAFDARNGKITGFYVSSLVPVGTESEKFIADEDSLFRALKRSKDILFISDKRSLESEDAFLKRLSEFAGKNGSGLFYRVAISADIEEQECSVIRRAK